MKFHNKTIEAIFYLILDNPLSRGDIATKLSLAEKTVINSIPWIRKTLEKEGLFYFIENEDPSCGEKIYYICKNNDFRIKVKDRIFSCSRAEQFPYLIINLPPPPKGYESWKLYPIGDNHHGVKSEKREFLESQIKEIISSPNALGFIKGDTVEAAGKHSPGASVFDQTMTPQEQKVSFIKLMAPIAHKLLWFEGGNHDKDRTMKINGVDIASDIARALNIEYFPGAIYADIICQDYKWDIMSWHGSSRAGTKFGKMNAIMKKREFHSAHIYFMGHLHDLEAASDFEIVKDPKSLSLKFKKRLFILTGSTQGYFGSYAEEWVIPPFPCGYAVVELHCKGSKRPGDFSAIKVFE